MVVFSKRIFFEIISHEMESRGGGARALAVEELQKMAPLFNMTTDQILNYDGKIPADVTIEDKTNCRAEAIDTAVRRGQTDYLPPH